MTTLDTLIARARHSTEAEARARRTLVTPQACAVFAIGCFALWAVSFSTAWLTTAWDIRASRPQPTLAELVRELPGDWLLRGGFVEDERTRWTDVRLAG